MNNPLIYQAIGGLLVLFYFYLVYMFTKTWRWLHVTAAFFVFVAAIVLIIFASITVRTHSGWKTMAFEQKGRVRQMTDERDTLLYGDIGQVIQAEPSIRSVNGHLGRVLLDRGRVWRGCVPQAAADGVFTLSTIPPGTDPASAPPNRIQEKMVLYAFLEYAPPQPELFGLQPNTKVPGPFIGEFTATAATNETSVALRPTLPLSEYDMRLINQPGATWVLYESLPVDGHQTFAEDPLKRPNWSLPATEEPVFGDMNEQMIRAMFAPFFTDPAQADQLNAIIAPYLADGGRATNIEDYPPDNVWRKVRFLEEHKEIVDSDATVDAVQGSKTFFDRGRANVPMLRRGSDAEFKVNDFAVFPQEDADRLERTGIVEKTDDIFVRSLRNYEFLLKNTAQSMQKLAQDKTRVERDKAEVEATNDRTVAQINYLEQDREFLTTDLEKFQYELKSITEYSSTLDKQWAAKRGELSRLYQTNHQLEQELERLQRELTERINRATLNAVAGGAE